MEDMYILEFISQNMSVISGVLTMIQRVTAMLYINFTAKYKNQDLSPGWYIFAFFFPVLAAIVFAVKSKKFRHENTKVCSQCGDKYPETFSMCSRCLIELPDLNDPKRMQKKKLGKIFALVLAVMTVVTIVLYVVFGIAMVKETLELSEFDESNRIAVETIAGETFYFDREGEVYYHADQVPLYGRDGEVYTRIIKEVEDEAFGGTYEMALYVDSNDNEYDTFNCYVDEEGYFYYDEDFIITWDDSDYDYDADLDDCEEWFDEENYRYYQDRYVDEEGNIYYYADQASWNHKGELITAENDPNPPAVTE